MINFEQRLRENYGKWKDREYVYEKKEGCFHAVSYGDFLDNVRGFAKHLLSLVFSCRLSGENPSNFRRAKI